MAGFFDYLLGRDEYASDAPLDPTTGLRPADRRQAGINTLANVSQALMQIGAARNPREAASAWGMFPEAAGTGQAYLDALTKERRVLQQEQGLRDLMQNPEQLKGLGLNERQIGLMKFLPTDAAAAFVAKSASADPLKAQQAQALEDLISQLPPNQQLLARAAPQAFVTQILAAQKPESASADIKNYNFYKAQELAANRTPLPFNDWRLLASKASAATNVINLPGNENYSKGWEALDKSFAKGIPEWVDSGGLSSAKSRLRNIDNAINMLETENNITGPKVAATNLLGVTSFFNEDAAAVNDAVRSVVQSNLRAVLGAQFTEKEGERLIRASFNPALSQAENAKRLKILRDSIEETAQLKSKMLKYFTDNGTLKGFDIVGASPIGFFENRFATGLSKLNPKKSDPSNYLGK